MFIRCLHVGLYISIYCAGLKDDEVHMITATEEDVTKNRIVLKEGVSNYNYVAFNTVLRIRITCRS